jgi:WD40 repeat protein
MLDRAVKSTAVIVLLSYAFSFSPLRGEPLTTRDQPQGGSTDSLTHAASSGSAQVLVSQTKATFTEKTAPITILPNIGDLKYSFKAVFSPNEQVVATFDGGWFGFEAATSVKLWDVASGRPRRTLEYNSFFTAVSFTPDGALVASAHADGKIKFWDVVTGENVSTLSTERDSNRKDADWDNVSSLWIDDTGELIVAGHGAGHVTVWNIQQRELMNRFKLDDSEIYAARLSRDRSRLIAITRDLVEMFDVKSKKVVSSFKLADNYQFFKDSIVGDDDFVIMHKVTNCQIDQLMHISLKDTHNLIVIDEPLKCAQPSDDEELSDNTARICPIPSQEKIIITRHSDPEIKRWDLRTRRAETTIKWPHDYSANVIGFTRDCKLALTNDEDRVRIHNVETGVLVQELPSFGYSARNAVASNDGRHFLLFHSQSQTELEQKDIELWHVDEVSPKSLSGDFMRDYKVF